MMYSDMYLMDRQITPHAPGYFVALGMLMLFVALWLCVIAPFDMVWPRWLLYAILCLFIAVVQQISLMTQHHE
jgi:hypothetical protein